MDDKTTYMIANCSKTMLKVYVLPGASKNEFIGSYGVPSRLKIRIKGQAQSGQANTELIAFLAKKLKVAKSKIEIMRGHISRQKDLLIDMDIVDFKSAFFERK